MAANLHDNNLVSALLEGQQNHRAVKFHLKGASTPSFGTLLGFDYYESSLLIEGFEPPTNPSTLESMKTSPFWVQMKHESGFLNIQALVHDQLHDLYTLKIYDYEFSANQRWFPRIHFAQRQGPTFTFDLETQLPLQSYLKNLSTWGAALEVYGEDVREQFSGVERCQGRIKFNELFSLPVEAEIRQLAFERRAPRRSEIRVIFHNLPPTHVMQLESFIEAFQHKHGSVISELNKNHAA